MKPLESYMLRLGDNCLVLGQRLAEWCGHAPVLEQDIALTNLSLDLIGQARMYYQQVASLRNDGSSEDSIAFLREEHEYRNLLLCEYPNTDFAFTIARQFFFDAFHYHLLDFLRHSPDGHLAAIAAKAFKEASYHLKYSSEWMIRLGDGTEESKRRLQSAVTELWPYTGELYTPDALEEELASLGLAPRLSDLKIQWMDRVQAVLQEAGMELPLSSWMQSGGKKGVHTEHMGYLLSDLQYMQRAYPGLEW